MIASVRGRLLRKYEDRVVVEAAGVGYEVFIPPVVQRAHDRLTRFNAGGRRVAPARPPC